VTGLRQAAALLAVLAGVALVVPAGAVHPTSISLTTVETAKAVDAGDGVLWVLALGSDARPGDDVMEGLTDAIQLVGIDWTTGRAVGIGIPRDSWVELPSGFARINTALAAHGPDEAARQVADLTGITPDLVLVTGFEGFLSMVGAIDGVEVDSPLEFRTDSLGVEVRRGPNAFDARQALDFARTRRGLPRSDFDRSANHQRLLLGVLQQLRGREDQPGFLEGAALAALEGLQTDLSPGEIYRLVQAGTQVDPSRVTTCVVGGDPGVEFGASIIHPDRAQARALGDDAREDARLQGGCRD
jgi:LCP family protein required for cell wall assembly